MAACTNLHHRRGACISRKRITISTAGLTPMIERFARERQPWRLHLSLHSAVQEVREQIMPIARQWPLTGLLDAMRIHQETSGAPWITLQYVAIPGVNMDADHVDAEELKPLGGRELLSHVTP